MGDPLTKLWHRTLWNEPQTTGTGGTSGGGGSVPTPVSVTVADSNWFIVDSLHVADFVSCHWFMQVDDVIGENRLVQQITAAHNGIGSKVATDVKYTSFNRILLGSQFLMQVVCEIAQDQTNPLMLMRVKTVPGAKIVFWRSVYLPGA